MKDTWNKGLEGIRDSLESITDIISVLVEIEKARIEAVKGMVEFMDEQQKAREQWVVDQQNGNTQP